MLQECTTKISDGRSLRKGLTTRVMARRIQKEWYLVGLNIAKLLSSWAKL